MKPIGPYVAVQELPTVPPGVAAADSPIQTLRATDRLTGIPVLLHVLPFAQSLPEVPFSPHLLPVVDSGVDGEQAYLVTELPLQAHPARDPLLAARGALTALAALHADGLAHGGVSAAQLWTLGGGVALAGAGLPWREDATPVGDLSDLAATLQDLGALPEALLPLRDHPGALNAREALFLLGSGTAAAPVQLPKSQSPESQPPERQSSEVQHSESGAEPERPQVGAAVPTQPRSAGETGEPAPHLPRDVQPRHDGTPIVLGQPEGTGSPSVDWDDAAPAPPPAVPTGQPETPQERRKRQNDERRGQATLDSQAAAVRKAERLKAQQEEEARAAAKAAQQAALGLPVPEPFQMGFAQDPGREPAATAAAQASRTRQVERLPASLRRPATGEPGAVRRLPTPSAAAGPASASTAALTAGGAAKRNLPPIRIGWDEDDSWRVVRAAPAPRPFLSRWLWPIVALVLLLGVIATWLTNRPKAVPAPAAAACCTVSFALRGAAGVTAQLSVDTAPDGANLSPGDALGVIPGKIDFPAEGRYRLRVAAKGYQPNTLNVTVPSAETVNIDLGQ